MAAWGCLGGSTSTSSGRSPALSEAHATIVGGGRSSHVRVCAVVEEEGGGWEVGGENVVEWCR